MEDEPRIAAWNAKVDWPLTGLTVVFLAGYAWQVLDTSLGPAARGALDLVLTGIWLLLGLDYLVRLGLARRKLRFVGRHLLDLLILVLPMFRPLRALRVVTVIGVLNRQLRDDFRGRVPIYVGTTVALVGFVAALAVLEAERSAPDASITTFGEAVWWTITTISTVGYGDRYPVTNGGRVVGSMIIVIGVGIFGTFTGYLANFFLAPKKADAAPEATDARASIEQLRGLVAQQQEALDRLEAALPGPQSPSLG